MSPLLSRLGIGAISGGFGFGKKSTTTPKILIDYLVLGGGGGGSNGPPGPGPSWNGQNGAGAGGYVSASTEILNGTVFTISVGNGGPSGSAGQPSTLVSPSITPITAYGGGAPGSPGGSGGGAGGSGYGYPGPNQQGYPGGNYGPPTGTPDNDRGTGGGGGGAGGVGGNGVTDGAAGSGGVGRTWFDGVTYAVGGSGSGWNYSSPGTPQPSNSGNGGPAAGGQRNDPYGIGGSGGPGVVIIRYSSTYSDASSVSGSYNFSTVSGYKYYKFTGPGNITLDNSSSTSIYNTSLTDGTISGSSTVGSTLTYTTATFSSNPTSSVSWVWYSSGTVVQTGGSTYTLVSGDVGKNITVSATSTNTAGLVTVTSNSIAVYKSAPDTTITFTSSGTFSVPSQSNILIIACDGATGGGGPGGAGGRTVATFTGMVGQSLAISIAGGGVGSASGGCAGECSRYNRPAILSSGGNYAGVFVTSVSQANTLILAGGGGAGGFIDVSAGGAGGGTSGSAGGDASGSSGGPGVYRYGGGGGTQSAGGSGGSGYESTGGSGSALQGGGNATSDLGRSGSGAGGGGYYGGGGGGAGYDSGNYASTAGGGGGSSYIRPDGTSTTNTPGGTQASAGRVVIQY